jgi:hypothetical protein
MNKNVSEIFWDKRTEEQIFRDKIYVIMFLCPKQKIMFLCLKLKIMVSKLLLRNQSSPPKVGGVRRSREVVWCSRYTIARPTATWRSREEVWCSTPQSLRASSPASSEQLIETKVHKNRFSETKIMSLWFLCPKKNSPLKVGSGYK